MYSLGYDFVVSSDLTRQTDQVIIFRKGVSLGKAGDTMVHKFSFSFFGVNTSLEHNLFKIPVLIQTDIENLKKKIHFKPEKGQWTFYSATSFLEKCRKVVLEKWFFKLGFFFSGQPLFSNLKKCGFIV